MPSLPPATTFYFLHFYSDCVLCVNFIVVQAENSHKYMTYKYIKFANVSYYKHLVIPTHVKLEQQNVFN